MLGVVDQRGSREDAQDGEASGRGEAEQPLLRAARKELPEEVREGEYDDAGGDGAGAFAQDGAESEHGDSGEGKQGSAPER